MTTRALAVLILAFAVFARAQEDEGDGSASGGGDPGSITADHAQNQDAGGLHAVHDKDPTANPDGGGAGECAGEPIPTGKFKIQYKNGWFPKVSPCGDWVAYGFGAVSVVNVRTHKEKLVKEGDSFVSGWVRAGTMRYLKSTGNATADPFTASSPGFSGKKTKDKPELAAGNFHAAADGHWASVLGGRLAYDNKQLQTGAGNVVDTSNGWLVTAVDNSHAALRVWRNGKKKADYPVKVPMTELSIRNGWIAYGPSGGPIHGITPGGADSDVSAAPPGYIEYKPDVFFVGTGSHKGPWIATMICSKAGAVATDGSGCWTMLRPWGFKRGIVLDEGAAGLSAVENRGRIVLARCDDKGRGQVDVVNVTDDLYTLKEHLDTAFALKKGGRALIDAASARAGVYTPDAKTNDEITNEAGE